MVPKGDFIRPTSVMLRRRVFDHFQNLSGIVFVDLCAGSGAMGFEAWSRGASLVYLNEINRHVFKILEENRENLLIKNHHKKNGEIICNYFSAEKWIKEFRMLYENFSNLQKEETVIFLDPPYLEKEIYTNIIYYLKKEPWYFGQLWIESSHKKGFSLEALAKLEISAVKIFEQGESYLFVTNFPQAPLFVK